MGKARTEHDHKDTSTLLEFTKERNPFTTGTNLRNIETGVIADGKVDVDRSVEIGNIMLRSMEGQQIDDYVFQTNKQVVTLASKTNLKVDGDEISLDPQLLFQRLLSAASGMFPDLSEIFRYELCNNPAALLEPSGMMRPAQKANLADTICNLGDCSAADVVIQDNTRHVIDGGSLIQRIPWNKGATFGQICQMYLDYLTKRYAHPVVVFDGYFFGPSTKDHTHSRRTKGIERTKIEFRKNTPFKSKKENFLCINENKQAFMNMPSEFLVSNGIGTT